MKSTRVSYSFGTIDVEPTKVPSSNYGSVPHSVDFIPKQPGAGFIKDTGGIVYGVLSYNSTYLLNNPLDIPYKSWVENYVVDLITDLTTGEGGLSEGAVRGLFSTPSEVLNYTPSTGVFTLDLDLSKFSNSISKFLTTEVDPVFTTSPAYNLTNQHILDLNEVVGWYNGVKSTPLATETYVNSAVSPFLGHSSRITTLESKSALWDTAVQPSDLTSLNTLYKPIGWNPDWNIPGDIQNQPILEAVATTGDFSDLLNTPEPEEYIPQFTVEDANKFLRINPTGTDRELVHVSHDDLITGGEVLHHLDSTEYARATTAAGVGNADGYLTFADWQDFKNKLDNFIVTSNLLTWEEGSGGVYELGVVPELLPVDDEATNDKATLSAQKIYQLLQGEEEEEEEDTTSVSYGQSFSIFIPAGASLTGKLGGAVKVPADWTLDAIGGSNTDLEITHNLEKLPASIAVFRRNGDNTKSKLEGATAYGDAKSTTDDKKLVLTSYANTTLATEIRLIF